MLPILFRTRILIGWIRGNPDILGVLAAVDAVSSSRQVDGQVLNESLTIPIAWDAVVCMHLL